MTAETKQTNSRKQPKPTREKFHTMLQPYTHQNSKQNGGNGASNEPFPGFLWRQLDQRCPAEEETKHVGHDVITDDHRHRNQKPTHTVHTPGSVLGAKFIDIYEILAK